MGWMKMSELPGVENLRRLATGLRRRSDVIAELAEKIDRVAAEEAAAAAAPSSDSRPSHVKPLPKSLDRW